MLNIAEIMDTVHKSIWLNKDPSLDTVIAGVIDRPRALLTFKMSA